MLSKVKKITSNKKKLSILMPNLKGGGAERVAVNLANHFSLRGYLVEMVLLSANGEFLTDLNQNITVVDLNIKRMRGAIIPLIRYFRLARPDSILANMWPLTIIALIAHKISCLNARIVVVEHTTWSKDAITRSRCGRWLVSTTMQITFPYASSIVAVSRGAADDLALFTNLDRNAITVIYNPVSSFVAYVPEMLKKTNTWCTGDHKKILSVGSLSPIKDHATLLKAFALLIKKVDAKLMILGDGMCRSEIEVQAEKLGLENNFYLPGFEKNPAPYYQNADLFVMSSSGEGFGNVIVEAMAAGTPVVSTDCQSGPSEILDNGRFGQLVPVGDAYALANAMLNALNTEHNSNKLRQRALDFSIDKAVDKYIHQLFII